MFWLILSAITVMTLFLVLGLTIEDTMCGLNITGWGFKKRQAFAIIGILFILPGFFTIVPANNVGIKYSMFTGVSEESLTEGIKLKGLFDKVYKISTEVQTMKVENLTTQTKDAQYVITMLDVKYRVKNSNAYLIFSQYRTLDKMSKALILPTTQRVLELVTTKYNVIDVLGAKKSNVYTELEAALTEEFAKYGVEFYSVSLTDMTAGDAIEAAIEEEAVAKKAVETAEQELLKAEIDAKQKSVAAKAEQDAARIEAETKLIRAKADKEANELLQQSLTEQILMQMWIERWNGKVPTYYGGDGADLIFNTGSLE